MPIEFGPVTEPELTAFFAAEASAYSSGPSIEDETPFGRLFDFGRSMAARDGRQIVGGSVYYRLDLSVPGVKAPAGGVTHVFTVPTHRRQGILTEIMRRQLQMMHSEGIVLAGLHAAESSIYGRFGYGPAAPTEVLEIERGHARFRREFTPAGSFHLVDDDEAMDLFPDIYESYRTSTPGLFSRDDEWWRLRFRAPGRAQGSPNWLKAVYKRRGRPLAYVIYSLKSEWVDAVPRSTLNVIEMAYGDPESYAAIWHHLFGIDLVRLLHIYSPINPLIWWMLADPRRLTRRIRDGLWLRLVDMPSALFTRQYLRNANLTLRVEDTFCPWNDGTYRLESEDGNATCARTDSSPDLVVSADALASCYLGANDFHTLAAAGLAEEQSRGALSLASAMFGWHTPPMTSAPEPLT